MALRQKAIESAGTVLDAISGADADSPNKPTVANNHCTESLFANEPRDGLAGHPPADRYRDRTTRSVR